MVAAVVESQIPPQGEGHNTAGAHEGDMRKRGRLDEDGILSQQKQHKHLAESGASGKGVAASASNAEERESQKCVGVKDMRMCLLDKGREVVCVSWIERRVSCCCLPRQHVEAEVEMPAKETGWWWWALVRPSVATHAAPS